LDPELEKFSAETDSQNRLQIGSSKKKDGFLEAVARRLKRLTVLRN
jgi:hypothetical protein